VVAVSGGVSFAEPGWLLLAVPVAAFLYLTWRRSLVRLDGRRSTWVWAWRLTALLLILLALSGMTAWRKEKRLTVVFAADQSRSVGVDGQARIASALKEAAGQLPERDQAGVVIFGKEAVVEAPPREGWTGGGILARTAPDTTDIGSAVTLADGLFPAGHEARLVLLTDGLETKGSVEAAIARLPRDVDVVWLPIERSATSEILVEALHAPERVRAREPFRLRAVIRASEEMKATLRLYRQGVAVKEGVIDLRPGRENLFVLDERAGDTSETILYEVRVESGPGDFVENNSASALVEVEGLPRVLLIDRDPASIAPFARTLERAGIRTEVRAPGGLPATLVSLSAFDAVVLSDTGASRFSDAQLEMLRSYVEDLGGGFLMTGGPESFGPGGYRQTPVEKVLPLDMEVKESRYFPSLGLVICLDKSGSMGGYSERDGIEKIEIAKLAAGEVARMLTPMDRMGLVAFDDAAKVITPMTSGAQKEKILESLGTLRAGGGTDAYPALEVAGKSLKETNTKVKHVLLVTDGQLAARDHEGLVYKMAQDGMTVSTIGVGTDADIRALELIARAGSGTFHRAEDISTLPRLFLREAFRVARTFLVEERFQPTLRAHHPALGGLGTMTMPPLGGYVATAEKPLAQHLLGTHRKDPLLSVWRTGAGKAAAFTSDVKNRWAVEWMNWHGYAEFWPGLVRWCLRESASEDFRVRAEPSGEAVRVTVDAVTDEGEFENGAVLRGMIAASDGTRKELRFAQTGPGRYEAEQKDVVPGATVVAVIQEKASGEKRSALAHTVVPYSDEFRALPANAEAFERLVAIGRMRTVRSLDDVFTHRGTAGKVQWPLAPLLLAAATIALVGEVGARRLRLPSLKRKKPFEAEASADERLDALRAAKARVRDVAKPLEPAGEMAVGQTPEEGPAVPGPKASSTSQEGSYTSRLLAAKRKA
jgi:uncharacterized membrane protein